MAVSGNCQAFESGAAKSANELIVWMRDSKDRHQETSTPTMTNRFSNVSQWPGWARRVVRIALNNVLIAVGLDTIYIRHRFEWRHRRFDPAKSLEQNVGFSPRDDVIEARRRVADHLYRTAEHYVPKGGAILDIGSGTGMNARPLSLSWQVTGIDVSESLTEAARDACPRANFIVGDFMADTVGGPFQMAYSVSVLMYVPVSRLGEFFRRIHACLEPGGILFLQYHHARSRYDTWYPSLSYIEYSPRVVRRRASRWFDVIEHRHSFYADRIVDDYDRDPYPRPSFINGSVLVARRKDSVGETR